MLHAYTEQPITRQRLLKQVSNTDCEVLSIILNKKKVYTNLQDEKVVLYNFVTNILLDRLFTRRPIPISDQVVLIASQRETNQYFNKNFKEYLLKQVQGRHKSAITIEIKTPTQEKSLQVADFVSWAIFRKYEKGDNSYYDLIKSKILEESPLFP